MRSNTKTPWADDIVELEENVCKVKEYASQADYISNIACARSERALEDVIKTSNVNRRARKATQNSIFLMVGMLVLNAFLILSLSINNFACVLGYIGVQGILTLAVLAFTKDIYKSFDD